MFCCLACVFRINVENLGLWAASYHPPSCKGYMTPEEDDILRQSRANAKRGSIISFLLGEALDDTEDLEVVRAADEAQVRRSKAPGRQPRSKTNPAATEPTIPTEQPRNQPTLERNSVLTSATHHIIW